MYNIAYSVGIMQFSICCGKFIIMLKLVKGYYHGYVRLLSGGRIRLIMKGMKEALCSVIHLCVAGRHVQTIFYNFCHCVVFSIQVYFIKPKDCLIAYICSQSHTGVAAAPSAAAVPLCTYAATTMAQLVTGKPVRAAL